MSKVRIIALVATVLVVSAFGGARVYTRRPAYSLELLAEAVSARDQAAIARYIDVKATSAQLTDAMMSSALASASSRSQGSASGQAFAASMASEWKPMAARELEADMRKALTGSTPEAGSADAHASALGNLGSLLLGSKWITVTGFGETSIVGDTATVGVIVRDADLDTTVVFSTALARADDHWRVVGVRYIGDVMLALDSLKARRLADVNIPIRREMEKMIGTGDVSSALQMSAWFATVVTATVPIQNNGAKPVLAVGARLTSPTGLGRSLFVGFSGPVALQPGEHATMSGNQNFNQFDESSLALARSPSSFHPELEYLIAGSNAHADTIHTYPSWSDYRATHPVK